MNSVSIGVHQVSGFMINEKPFQICFYFETVCTLFATVFFFVMKTSISRASFDFLSLSGSFYGHYLLWNLESRIYRAQRRCSTATTCSVFKCSTGKRSRRSEFDGRSRRTSVIVAFPDSQRGSEPEGADGGVSPSVYRVYFLLPSKMCFVLFFCSFCGTTVQKMSSDKLML